MSLTWKEVCEDPSLADLPYKIELTGSGKILMSPPRSKHSIQQGKIARLLSELMPGGEAFPECPVDTDDNTKVIDVVWAPTAMIERLKEELSWPEAPPLCIEVVSPSNTFVELEKKRTLYFARGAVECWICKSSGEMAFYTRAGQVPCSELCPPFPAAVQV